MINLHRRPSGRPRLWRISAALLVACVTATACGTDEGSSSSESWRTVEHKFGTTEIPEAPERVVTVGISDHDAVLALGTVPVGITTDPDSSGDQPYGVWPWAQDELGDGKPEVLPSTEIDYERIAGLQPDLITAVYSGITAEDYQKLAQIAPTVAQSGEYPDAGMPWDEMTRLISRALGEEEQAEKLITEVENRFAEARAQHPEFNGRTAVYAGYLDAGQYYAETAQSSRVGVLTALGFEVPAEVRGDEFFVRISQEQLSLLDHDVLVWEIGDNPDTTAAIRNDPLYQQLNVAREGRDVFIEDELLTGGMIYISVLSLPHVIDHLVPKLTTAVDGDPATEVPN